MASPFEDRNLRDWFFGTFPLPELLPTEVAILGSGPFAETEFGLFLRNAGIEVKPVSPESTVVLLGRVEWNPESLWHSIENNHRRRIKIYSQEMFLAFWATCCDPFDMGNELLSTFASGHPALEALSQEWPEWPSTIIGEVSTGDLQAEWPQTGLLKHLGYCVGRNGLPESQRQAILRNAFLGELPHVQSAEYMLEWGTPSSPSRLKKLADSLAAFCRNAKRRQAAGHEMSEAIADWEADLHWLRTHFYHRDFPWPGTSGPPSRW